MPPIHLQLQRIEAAIRCDPARRGLLAGAAAQSLGVGQLAAAALDLARHARDVAIVTGFVIPAASQWRAETDGPPAAVLLADVLTRLGLQVRLMTDPPACAAVQTAAQLAGFASGVIECCPLGRDAGRQWCTEFLARCPQLTHLIAIERAGPSHTLESFARAAPPALHAEFARQVPPQHRDCCHNMRGESIDAHTAPLHLLFEPDPAPRVATSAGFAAHSDAPPDAPCARTCRTIGIGDGGNEIGMGSFPVTEMLPLLSAQLGPRILCRVRTDWTIVAGTSNWGGFALAAAVALLKGRPDLLADWTLARHEHLLGKLVQEGPAVDGVTREPTATVDGLPFLTYIQPWQTIREILGLAES